MKRLVCLFAAALPLAAQGQQQKIETFDVRVAGPAGAPAGDVMFFRNAVPGIPADTVSFVSAELAGPQTVKGAPYAAEITTDSVQTLADGNRIVHKNAQNVYRDTEGRTRREITVEIPGHPEENHKIILIEDPVAGVHYSLNSKDKTARKMPVPKWESTGGFTAPTMAMPANRFVAGGVMGGAIAAGGPSVMTSFARTARVSPENIVTDDLGTQNIEGVAAKGTKTTVTIPAGEIGNERALVTTTENWFCEELKITVLSKRADPRFGDSTTKAASLRRGDQPSYLFEVPADYKLMEMPAPRIERMKMEAKPPAEL